MRRFSFLAVLGLMALGSASQAQVTFFEEFEGPFLPTGWTQQNNSVSPQTPWTQAVRGSAIPGLNSNYANANFGSTAVGTPTGGTISNWLMTPTVSLTDGQKLSFWTASAGGFPDRLQVRWATAPSPTPGTLPTDVGDFSTLLLDINPTLAASGSGGYPSTWTNFTVTIGGIGTNVSGQLGFRYFVTDGGINGNNSDGIGIDGVTIATAPEPSSVALGLLALPALALIRRKRV